MIAKQSIYFNSDRSKVVPDGDPDAKFLIVRAGTEIDDKTLRNIDGAEELASQEPAPPKTPPLPAGFTPETKSVTSKAKPAKITPAKKAPVKKPAKK